MFSKFKQAPNLVLHATLAVMAAGVAGGCVKERPENCPPPSTNELQIVVNIVDASSNTPQTPAGTVTDGALFVFDAEGRLIHYQIVPAEDIGKQKSIPLPDEATRASGNEIYIAAWGNVVNNMTVTGDYNLGATLDRPYLDMRSDPDRAGSMMCPGEMFFGLQRLDPTAGPEGPRPVEVSRINARLAVTVRGIAARAGAAPLAADDYYFLIEGLADGYAFDGTPLDDDTRTVHEAGVFTEGDFVSPEPYNLIPSPEGNGQTVLHLMRTAPTRSENDIDISGPVSLDERGNPLRLLSGQTTNVLIDLTRPAAGIVVRVEITPWNEVYQWINT